MPGRVRAADRIRLPPGRRAARRHDRDPMPKLQLINVEKRFGEANVVRGISTSVAEGQMLVLLGRSGCGKTTTLRMVAGLLHPDGGSILIDDRMVAKAGWGLPPENRNLGMVFQT